MSPKRLQQHPLVLWACLLGALIGLTALSMGLLVLAPNSSGSTETNYAINSAFAFDEWEISTRHGMLSFPEGGLAVEAYQHDRLAAFVIWGKAEFDLMESQIDASELEDIEVTAVFMSERDLLNARGSVFIRGTDSPDACLQASELLNTERQSLPTLNVFGSLRSYPFPNGVARFVFLDNAGQRFTYQDGAEVSFQGPSSRQSFWSDPPRKYHPPLLDSALATVLYTSCILILLIATYFSTLGWQRSDNQQSEGRQHGLFYLALAISYTLVGALLARLELGFIVQITYDALFLALLVYWLNKQAPISNRQPVLPQLGVGLLLGGLAVFLGKLALPRGFAPLMMADYVLIISGGLIATLAHEALWRGLIVEHLSRRFKFPGLLLAAGLQGILAFGFWLIFPVSTLGPLNALVFVPLQALWLGYAYLRTNSLILPITISACLAILPQLLAF